MSRKNKKKYNLPQPQPQPQPQPRYKQIWYLTTFIVGIITAVILNTPNILESLRKIPIEFEKTKTAFMTWKSKDKEWEGKYISNPEGYLDFETMKLSSVSVEIVIWPNQGGISGTIVSPYICKELPFLKYAQLRGNVNFFNSNKAEVEVWDHISGKQVVLGKLLLSKVDSILIIKNISPSLLLNNEIRLAKDPNLAKDEINPDYDFCSKNISS